MRLDRSQKLGGFQAACSERRADAERGLTVSESRAVEEEADIHIQTKQ